MERLILGNSLGDLPTLGHPKIKGRKETGGRGHDTEDTSQKLELTKDHLPNSQILLPDCPSDPASRESPGWESESIWGKQEGRGEHRHIETAEFRPEWDLTIWGMVLKMPPAGSTTDQLWISAITFLNLFPRLENGTRIVLTNSIDFARMF